MGKPTLLIPMREYAGKPHAAAPRLLQSLGALGIAGAHMPGRDELQRVFPATGVQHPPSQRQDVERDVNVTASQVWRTLCSVGVAMRIAAVQMAR